MPDMLNQTGIAGQGIDYQRRDLLLLIQPSYYSPFKNIDIGDLLA
jgi:hypothetical protein